MPSPGLPNGSSFSANTTLAQALASGNSKPFQAFNQKFVSAAAGAGRTAAQLATSTSRNVFNSRLSGRPIAPARPGRPTTGGQFSQFIDWQYVPADDDVVLDLAALQTAAPYWAIQEIGTNHSATIIDSVTGPGSVTVRSQRGRRISSSLVWASGPGATASSPRRGVDTEQLFLRSQALANNLKLRRIRINQEIKAKHYLRDGAKSGFALYRREMTKAFRQAYR